MASHFRFQIVERLGLKLDSLTPRLIIVLQTLRLLTQNHATEIVLIFNPA